MRINLKEVPIVWINLKSNKKRSQQMTEIFNNYGLTNTLRFDAIEGVGDTEEKRIASGCAASHSEALKYILETFAPDHPVLILEDDIEITEDFQFELETPDEADCVYLGISHWGIHPKFARISNLISPTNAVRYSKNYYKISGMLSTHSILYLSEKYKRASQKTCETSHWHCDVALANDQKRFQVFSTMNPFFIQGEYPNKAVTSAPLYLNQLHELQPVFHSWWVKKYYNINNLSEDDELIIIE